jgi:hypothetical protein
MTHTTPAVTDITAGTARITTAVTARITITAGTTIATAAVMVAEEACQVG